MTKDLGWGILATGWIAGLFAQDLRAAGLKVAVVGSRSLDNAQAFAESYGIANAHGSYEELVADPAVDIVYVATPHPYHVTAALLALDAGKHVMIEKPFALTGSDARRIVERAREKELVVLEAMWTRFLPHMARIHAIIGSGTLGDLLSVSAEHRQFLPVDPKHRVNALELGSGALLDLGIYPISFAFDILGAPTSIKASARFKETGVDTEVAVIMEHEGGRISTSTAVMNCAGSNVAVINGSKARIEISSIWYTPTSFRVLGQKNELIEEFDLTVSGRGMQFQAFEMERLVREGGQSALMPPSQSVAIIETLDAIRREIGLSYPGEA